VKDLLGPSANIHALGLPQGSPAAKQADPPYSAESVIYLDNAASTEPAAEVLDALRAAAAELYANPASAHRGGAAAARALEQARGEVAAALDVEPGELLFTSGGTEADALGVLGGPRRRGRHRRERARAPGGHALRRGARADGLRWTWWHRPRRCRQRRDRRGRRRPIPRSWRSCW
jgi:hypothetical protein